MTYIMLNVYLFIVIIRRLLFNKLERITEAINVFFRRMTTVDRKGDKKEKTKT